MSDDETEVQRLDVNRLTVEVERLKSENTALRLRAERAEAYADGAKLLIDNASIERDDARRELACRIWPSGHFRADSNRRQWVDSKWGSGTAERLFR